MLKLYLRCSALAPPKCTLLKTHGPSTSLPLILLQERFLSITVQRQQVAVVDEFVYLGCHIHSSTQSTPDIIRHSGITHAAMQNLDNHCWRSRIPIPATLKLYNTCILPVFLYGSECWAVTQVDACRIDALDQWCLRTLLGIKWHQSFFFILSTSLLILYFENIPTPFPG